MTGPLVVAALVAAAVSCVAAAVPRAFARDDATSTASGRRRGIPPGVASTIVAPTAAAAGYALGGLGACVILGVGAAVVPIAVARRRRAKRAALIDEQLLDLVAALASAVRSGRSLEQALASATEELEPPLRASVSAIVDRVALGEPFDDALERWSATVGTADARLVVGVLRLHRRSGGSLTGPLDDLSTTLRSRRAGERELRSLTAQARLSAGILGLLPVGFFLFLSVVSRRDIEDAIRTPAGLGAIGVGVALQGAAFVWIRSLLKVDA